MTTLEHEGSCPQPEPFRRQGPDGRPELFCPTCGRTSLAEGQVVRLVQPNPRAGLLAFVHLPDEKGYTTAWTPGGDVRVRIYRRGRAGWRWECDQHGSNARPACAHVEAVMAAIGLPLDQVDRKGRP